METVKREEDCEVKQGCKPRSEIGHQKRTGWIQSAGKQIAGCSRDAK
jgi:hypothetical protein